MHVCVHSNKLPFCLQPKHARMVCIKVDGEITTMSGVQGAIVYYTQKGKVRDFFVSGKVIQDAVSYDFDGTEASAYAKAGAYETKGRCVSTWFSLA